METEVMLTTFDNPFNPFDEFVPWFLYDVEKGYYSCDKLARVAQLLRGDRSLWELSMKEDREETARAIYQIIDNDFTNTFTFITREVEVDTDDEEDPDDTEDLIDEEEVDEDVENGDVEGTDYT